MILLDIGAPPLISQQHMYSYARCSHAAPTDDLKSTDDVKRERDLLSELLELVHKRNFIIDHLEEDRLRYGKLAYSVTTGWKILGVEGIFPWSLTCSLTRPFNCFPTYPLTPSGTLTLARFVSCKP